jgi:hypothetical protein
MSARVKHFSSTRLHALREERHFALVEGFAFNKVTVLKIRDRTQNAHNTCNPCRTCGSCGSGNQQLIDNRAPRIVQLRPWPPYFQALSSIVPPDLAPIGSTISAVLLSDVLY